MSKYFIGLMNYTKAYTFNIIPMGIIEPQYKFGTSSKPNIGNQRKNT